MGISDNQIHNLKQIALNLQRNIVKMIKIGQGGHLGGSFFVSRKHENLEIIDRTGGGDSFASALIYNILKKKDPQEAIEFSTKHSALCHGFLGDWNWAYKEEVERVMKGASVGVVR